jgi:hypothetical protein
MPTVKYNLRHIRQQYVGSVEKTQAIAVLHEIIDVLQESILINSVSLDAPFLEPNNYQIRMGCCLDTRSMDLLKPVLVKNNLGMKIGNSFLILYSLSAKA